MTKQTLSTDECRRDLADLVATFTHTVNNSLSIMMTVAEDLHDTLATQSAERQLSEKLLGKMSRLSNEITVFRRTFPRRPSTDSFTVQELLDAVTRTLYIPHARSISITSSSTLHEAALLESHFSELAWVIRFILRQRIEIDGPNRTLSLESSPIDKQHVLIRISDSSPCPPTLDLIDIAGPILATLGGELRISDSTESWTADITLPILS